MRICSFLPSATEMVCALGLPDSLVGITYECDFPPEPLAKTVVVTSRLAYASSGGEIDRPAFRLACDAALIIYGRQKSHRVRLG